MRHECHDIGDLLIVQHGRRHRPGERLPIDLDLARQPLTQGAQASFPLIGEKVGTRERRKCPGNPLPIQLMANETIADIEDLTPLPTGRQTGTSGSGLVRPQTRRGASEGRQENQTEG